MKTSNNPWARRFAFFALLLFFQTGYATTLPQDTLDTVYAATFEVVVKKNEQDSLTYEQPLPLDSIPFHIRNDKYWSIGTAFAIGPNTFVSAAHVFGLLTESQNTEFYLRDRHGKVLNIDKVVKFFGNRDFIVFTLKDRRADVFFKTNENPTVNTKVFAVGNALGEGVVIRDGLYTSNTPEEVEGAWSWIRFSAAASPGNSGGPLLDPEGRVIGIVLRKSESENLNYALPIRELLQAPDNLAVHDVRTGYTLDNMNYQKWGRFQFERKLPLTTDELNDALSKAYYDFSKDLLDKLLAEHKDEVFPHGEGSRSLLQSTYNAVFPHIVWQRDDGTWTAFEPNKVTRADLGHNGALSLGRLKNTILYRIRKPDDITYSDFIQDGKLVLDYLLKAANVTRDIGSQAIRITSYGEPREETVHKDKYGRVWTIRKWLVEYDDTAVLTMTLPTPDGSVTLMRSDSTGYIDSHLLDLYVLADFAYISYYGTVKQWQDFFALKDHLPTPLRKVKLTYKPAKYLRFKSNQVAFDFDASLMEITDDSDLKLYLSYIESDGEIKWDIAGVLVGEDKNNNTYFAVTRNARPDESMSDSRKEDWRRMASQAFPYNKTSYTNEKNAYIRTVYTGGTNAKNLEKKQVLFSVQYGTEGKAEQTVLEGKINTFVEKLDIEER